MQSPSAVEPPVDQKDDIDLAEIVGFFREFWRLIALVTTVTTGLGAALAVYLPPRFEAIAHVQMAVVANAAVEPPTVLAEKLKIPTYYADKTLRICGLSDEVLGSEILSKELKPTLNKNAPLVTLSFKGPSSNFAQTCLEQILADIGAQQGLIAGPTIANKTSLLKTLEDKLDAAEQIKAQFSSKAMSFEFNDPKFSAATLLFSTLSAKEGEIKDLRNQILELRNSLVEPQTRGTSLATPIYASGVRVEPRRSLVILAAMLLGLALSLILVLSQKGIRRYRAEAAAVAA